MRCVRAQHARTLDAVLAGIIDCHGVDSAIARCKELRENMEADRYDFGGERLTTSAQVSHNLRLADRVSAASLRLPAGAHYLLR
jgi:hypothetical protein